MSNQRKKNRVTACGRVATVVLALGVGTAVPSLA